MSNIYEIVSADFIIHLLTQKGLTIACAESCTGGLLASRFIDQPGASVVFLEGVIAYSNDAKIRRLNVSPSTLQTYGAVSSQTAEEMAKGIVETSGSAIGLSTTGIAGPDGGTADKPVGLVFICCHNTQTGLTKTWDINLKGTRNQIRSQTVNEMISLLFASISDYN
jgi:nicotinamide-nucleotide amidase